MKEKRHKSHKTKDKKHKKEKKKHRSSSSSSNDSDEWVEKECTKHPETSKQQESREDWMSMTGMIKTYTKEDIKPKREEDKRHIDSYNPATSTRELNPYWKQGGTGLPQTSEETRKSRQFLKPIEDDTDYYKSSKHRHSSSSTDAHSKSNYHESYRDNRSSSWRKESRSDQKYRKEDNYKDKHNEHSSEQNYNKNAHKSNTTVIHYEKSEPSSSKPVLEQNKAQNEGKYLSDEKMNKLGAKIVKAEIMGDLKLVAELKAKLEAAREYRKQNPDAKPIEEDDRVMLMSTNSTRNSRPLTNTAKGDPRSKSGKRKAETHLFGERAKYYGNDDKYNLKQMFENEKYGNNYNDEAELAKIASKHKNPNDDLEDIFMDEISKNRSDAKDQELERQRAIKQHVQMEKSLEGCEYCLESKNMLKHLIVSCGNKAYVALPSRKSLVTNQCLISTIHHATCVTALDEDVWEEILNYRKALTQFFNAQNMDVVFYETATRLHRYPHMVINCVPMPRDVGDTAPIYFKKALLECEAEWSMNKKVVELKGKNIRKGVPKGLPYFWVDFGMDPGFAHVIEDQQLFPRTFAEEIIAGILDLHHSHWKNTKKEYQDLQRKKVIDFLKDWKQFDPFMNKLNQ